MSVVVPCRNEAPFVKAFVESVMAQEDPGGGFEVIVADGCSDDGTRDELARLATRHVNLVVIDNPERIVSTGLNAAILRARGQVIVRLDVHTRYAPDYIRQCVDTLRRTQAQNVGGPWRAEGHVGLQAAIALAFQSRFSSGGAASRRLDYEGPVDTVYLGCWRKQTLLDIGLFDEDLVRNQDDELNLRLTRAGGRVWQAPAIRSWYSPRSSLSALFRQFSQYGYWKVRVIAKHQLPASPRHLVPAAFVLTLGVCSVLAPFSRWAMSALVVLAGGYLVANLLASFVVAAAARNWRALPVLPAVFGAFHLGYGGGFLCGLIARTGLLGSRGSTFTRITRR